MMAMKTPFAPPEKKAGLEKLNTGFEILKAPPIPNIARAQKRMTTSAFCVLAMTLMPNRLMMKKMVTKTEPKATEFSCGHSECAYIPMATP